MFLYLNFRRANELMLIDSIKVVMRRNQKLITHRIGDDAKHIVLIWPDGEYIFPNIFYTRKMLKDCLSNYTIPQCPEIPVLRRSEIVELYCDVVYELACDLRTEVGTIQSVTKH